MTPMPNSNEWKDAFDHVKGALNGEQGYLNSLLLPNRILIDAEKDDNLSVVLLAHLRKLRGLEPLKVFVQLGTTLFQERKVQSTFKDSPLATFDFFEDPESKNLTSVAEEFSIELPPQKKVVPAVHLQNLVNEGKMTKQTMQRFFAENICQKFFKHEYEPELAFPNKLPKSSYQQDFATIDLRQEMYAVMWEYVIFGTGKTIAWTENGMKNQNRIGAMKTIALGWHEALKEKFITI
jgi:hypothetical protein